MNNKIDREVVGELRNWFNNYVQKFNRKEDADFQQNIDLKREHTERVVREIIRLGNELKLDEYALNLAGVIALFHDIGRFEQYKRYQTFSDARSEDHALLGIRVLEENDVLGALENNTQKLILCAIEYHNRPFLPDWESKTCLFYSRLIRDADKLDIWKVVLDYYNRSNGGKNTSIELELPDTPEISKEVFDSLMHRQIVYTKHVRNLNDFKLLQAGWIYDINFEPAFRTVRKRGYLESLRKALPDTEQIHEIFKVMDDYMRSRE